MKSSNEALRRRGYINCDEYIENGYTQDEIQTMLLSKEAYNRSRAIQCLKKVQDINDNEIKQLVEMLTVEKALYTKIYVCELLSSLGEDSIHELIPYLGKIGSNQYTEIPNQVSKKKSYPLARDIVARTLAVMPISCYPSIIKILDYGNMNQILEILDAIGYMAFYHPGIRNIKDIKKLNQVYETYKDNTLMVWKLVTCLSGFSYRITSSLLDTIEREQKHLTIHKEIERTRKLSSYVD